MHAHELHQPKITHHQYCNINGMHTGSGSTGLASIPTPCRMQSTPPCNHTIDVKLHKPTDHIHKQATHPAIQHIHLSINRYKQIWQPTKQPRIHGHANQSARQPSGQLTRRPANNSANRQLMTGQQNKRHNSRHTNSNI